MAVCLDWGDFLEHSEAIAAWLRQRARISIVQGRTAEADTFDAAANRLALSGNLLVMFAPRCAGGAR